MHAVKKSQLEEFDKEELFMAKDAENEKRIHIFNNNIDLWFDLDDADIISYSIEGIEMLAGRPTTTDKTSTAVNFGAT